jgi:2'-5' RNA ligase
MHGLVSLLDEPHYQLVESIWQMLEEECGLAGIRVTPFPHFSWLIGSDFEWEALKVALQELAAQARPFTVRTTGLGLFTGSNPVVFIPVIRSKELSEFHQLIWEHIQPFGEGLSPHYSPAYWSPHISLAYSDVTLKSLSCAMNRLAFQAYNWEIRIDNITLIYEPDGQVGTIRYHCAFNG